MAEKLRGIPFDANEIILPDGSPGYDNILYSEDMSEWLGTYFKNGVLVPGGAMISDELKVTKTEPTKIQVNAGNIVVNGRTAFVKNPIVLDVGAITSARQDRVVIELNLTDLINSFRVLILQGSSDVPPELTRTDKVYQMSLAVLKLNTEGVLEVVDERANEGLCGVSQVLIGVKPPLPVTGDEASNIGYDNSSSGLKATNVQDALDEVVSKTYSGVLPKDGWTSGNGFFTKTVTVTGVLETDNPILDVVTTTANFKEEQKAWGTIFKAETLANKIKFYASEVPSVSVNFKAKVVK